MQRGRRRLGLLLEHDRDDLEHDWCDVEGKAPRVDSRLPLDVCAVGKAPRVNSRIPLDCCVVGQAPRVDSRLPLECCVVAEWRVAVQTIGLEKGRQYTLQGQTRWNFEGFATWKKVQNGEATGPHYLLRVFIKNLLGFRSWSRSLGIKLQSFAAKCRSSFFKNFQSQSFLAAPHLASRPPKAHSTDSGSSISCHLACLRGSSSLNTGSLKVGKGMEAKRFGSKVHIEARLQNKL